MHIHPLENNLEQRQYFERIKVATVGTGAAAYRKAVIACTGSLPTWCQRQKPGRRPGVCRTVHNA